MSDATTKRMLAAYIQEAPVSGFLSSFFTVKAGGIHNSQTVEIDIDRSEEEISIAMTSLETGARIASNDIYTNKEFLPPVLKEKVPVNAHDLVKRVVGENPFQDPNFQANATMKALNGFNKIIRKMHRTLELQGSQVLTTGKIDLPDAEGGVVYSLDYAPKASHFPTAGTAWGAPGATPLTDIDNLAKVIRTDGQEKADQIIFGDASWLAFMNDPAVIQQFEIRRADRGEVARIKVNSDGGTLHGSIDIGSYSYDLWTYVGEYKNPSAPGNLQFLPDDKVIVRASNGRMDKTFGNIPNLTPNNRKALPSLPTRIDSRDRGISLSTTSWVTDDGETLFAQAGTRPLLIPVAMDTYGCMTTGV